MKQLEINDHEYEVKFDYNFYNRLLEEADAKSKNNAKNKDNGGAINTDGFNQLILQLIDRDPQAIVDAYRAAIVGKKRPTRRDIEAALAKSGVWDAKDPFGDLYKELKTDGFLRLKIQHLLHSMKEDITTSKIASEAVLESVGKSKKKEDQNAIQEAKNNVIIARKTYEMMKDFLDRLEK